MFHLSQVNFASTSPSDQFTKFDVLLETAKSGNDSWRRFYRTMTIASGHLTLAIESHQFEKYLTNFYGPFGGFLNWGRTQIIHSSINHIYWGSLILGHLYLAPLW